MKYLFQENISYGLCLKAIGDSCCVTVDGRISVELQVIHAGRKSGYFAAVSWVRWRKLRDYSQVSRCRDGDWSPVPPESK